MIYWSDKISVRKIISSLNNSEICIGSSDTVLGLLSNVSEESFDKLNFIKGRSDKPYIVLIKNRNCIIDICESSQISLIDNIYSWFWPGPLTVVMRALPTTPYYMMSKDSKIAFRVPRHKGLQMVLDEIPMLFSTSANKTNDYCPSLLTEVHYDILKNVSYVIGEKLYDYTINDCSSVPSTIIDISNDNEICVLRQGAYSIDDIKKRLNIPIKVIVK